MSKDIKFLIDEAFNKPDLLNQKQYIDAVNTCVANLDTGKWRIAQNTGNNWVVNEWLKKAVLLFFRIRKVETIDTGFFEFADKIPVKKSLGKQGVRVVPQAIARYGSYLAPGVVLMPSYVNIGAYVDEYTMVDTWATVGSCAQIGKNVHLSGGVGIGGVLEPVQAAPVIIEDKDNKLVYLYTTNTQEQF
ncbi:MAG TPA: 2,3,4,5-tetrahydropyridine-2,6-dicarboxylate N-succinyltransferase, partial [Bacteroidales bacterium]|nr:2,3,4,5-tetrahydropyridine-2,6-dicarboxylate N-succinyltransferase [Bacteroidales bacterium]